MPTHSRSLTALLLGIALISAANVVTAQSPGSLVPWLAQPFMNAAGTAPLALGTITSYVAGTSTPRVTYANAELTTANPNPLTLTSSGRAENGIWIGTPVGQVPACYRFVIKTAAGVTVSDVDNVCDPSIGLPDISAPFDGNTARADIGVISPALRVTLQSATSYAIGATVFGQSQTGGFACRFGGTTTNDLYKIAGVITTLGSGSTTTAPAWVTVITQALSSSAIGADIYMRMDGYIRTVDGGILQLECGPRTVDGTLAIVTYGSYIEAKRQ